jgi:hypothetical protein
MQNLKELECFCRTGPALLRERYREPGQLCLVGPLLGHPTYHCPLFSPSPSSRSFLRQPPLLDNMLLSHITLTLAWAWAWALLPVLVMYAVFSRVRTWLGLRHIPGPPLVGWSKAWLLRRALGGRFHLDTAEVCEKYGQCCRRVERERNLRPDSLYLPH